MESTVGGFENRETNLHSTMRSFEHCTLLGLYDASRKAYAALVYFWDGADFCRLIASKTRVAPLLKAGSHLFKTGLQKFVARSVETLKGKRKSSTHTIQGNYTKGS